MKLPDEMFLCARADRPVTSRGATFDRRCSICGYHVMIAPSGQRFLEKNPLPIVCVPCGLKNMTREQLYKAGLAGWEKWPEHTAEVKDELRQGGIPNLWRKRN